MGEMETRSWQACSGFSIPPHWSAVSGPGLLVQHPAFKPLWTIPATIAGTEPQHGAYRFARSTSSGASIEVNDVDTALDDLDGLGPVRPPGLRVALPAACGSAATNCRADGRPASPVESLTDMPRRTGDRHRPQPRI